MAISSEFEQAVQENNLLRVRIMLKDSLLLDKSFRLFDEMQAYASSHNASPWVDADIPLEKAEKPWTESIMNYELAALVNNFTKERVEYVQAIISEIDRVSVILSQETKKRPAAKSTQPQKNHGSFSESIKKSFKDPGKQILDSSIAITKILKKNKDKDTMKRRWPGKDIDQIKRHAQKIVDACDDMEGRR